MNLFSRMYLRFFVKSGFPYARYLKARGVFHSQGRRCFVSKSANIPDPYLLSIGDNVWITSGCQLLCHDASVIMINIMRTGHLDRVGPIVIGSNSFLGNNAIVLANTRIGSRVIIGAGSVVTKDIPDNSVHAGNPARFVTTFGEYVEKIEKDSAQYPWQRLLEKHRTHIFDPALEERLKKERIEYFFSEI